MNSIDFPCGLAPYVHPSLAHSGIRLPNVEFKVFLVEADASCKCVYVSANTLIMTALWCRCSAQEDFLVAPDSVGLILTHKSHH